MKLQDWVVATRRKVVILFEGRDAAGKGGAIKRIPNGSIRVSAGWWPCPRLMIGSAPSGISSAMAAPSARGRGNRLLRPQLVQPRRGRARHGGSAHRRTTRSSTARCRTSNACWSARVFISSSTGFRSLTRSSMCAFLAGSMIRSSSGSSGPMDLESRRRWEDYTRAKEIMLERSRIYPKHAGGWSRPSTRSARGLNCIHHLLQQFPYAEVEKCTIVLPERERHDDYSRHPVPPGHGSARNLLNRRRRPWRCSKGAAVGEADQPLLRPGRRCSIGHENLRRHRVRDGSCRWRPGAPRPCRTVGSGRGSNRLPYRLPASSAR